MAAGRRSAEDELPDDAARHETAAERSDRNFLELLQELRVVLTGVQILFAFLLTLPFSQRFASTTAYQRDIYLATLATAALASALLLAPVAFHRLLFRRHQKGLLVDVGNALAISGLCCVALSITGGLLLVTDIVAGAIASTIMGVVSFVLLTALWFMVPLQLRRSTARLPTPVRDGGSRAPRAQR